MLGDQLARSFKQDTKYMHGAAAERHRLVAFQQKKLCGQQAESQLVSAELSLCSVSLAISRQCWAILAKNLFAVGFFAAAELHSASSDFVR
jgi:hypothetical protein